jgi:hypothetical protein
MTQAQSCGRRHATAMNALPLAGLLLLSAVVTIASAQSVNGASSETGGTLLEGGIVTRYDVQEYADLSLDIRDMRTYADSKDIQRLKGVYENGFHAERFPGQLFALKYLSDSFAEKDALLTPNFLYHIYGLTSDLAPTQSLPTRMSSQQHYQSAYISKIIQGDRPALAADAVIALSMWMYATHLLYSSVYYCQERTDANNPDVLPAVTGFDEFIALWIGRDQTAGSTDGHGLYAWTQEIGDYFQTNSPEAAVNSRIKLLYQEGATALSLGSACTNDNDATVQVLWNGATQIVTAMMIPLFQWFIFNFIHENEAEAALYAKALLPQLSRCRPSLYIRLAKMLTTGIQFDDKEEVLRDIQDAFSCFGISCSDIANFAVDNTALQCESTSPTLADDVPPSLAGYRATSAVAPVRVDRDRFNCFGACSSLTNLHFWHLVHAALSNRPGYSSNAHPIVDGVDTFYRLYI